MAEFAIEYPEDHKKWYSESKSIICLSAKSEEDLFNWYFKLKNITNVSLFKEPDLNDEATSLCCVMNEKIRKLVSSLPLLGKQKYSYIDVIKKMSETPQTDNMSVLEHGLSVNKYYYDFISNEPKFKWYLPDFIIDNKHIICNNIYKNNIMDEYQILHDCGKPYCITYDNEGKRHFPDHANISANIYSNISNNKEVYNLIKNDMLLHTVNAEDLNKILQTSNIKMIMSLLVTAYCELHSNANMFGGLESISFKIKYKHLTKRAKQIMKFYFPDLQ